MHLEKIPDVLFSYWIIDNIFCRISNQWLVMSSCCCFFVFDWISIALPAKISAVFWTNQTASIDTGIIENDSGYFYPSNCLDAA